MLTVTSQKFSTPEDLGKGYLRLIHREDGEEILVRKCNFYDAALGKLLRFVATEQSQFSEPTHLSE